VKRKDSSGPGKKRIGRGETARPEFGLTRVSFGFYSIRKPRDPGDKEQRMSSTLKREHLNIATESKTAKKLITGLKGR